MAFITGIPARIRVLRQMRTMAGAPGPPPRVRSLHGAAALKLSLSHAPCIAAAAVPALRLC